MVLSDFPGRFAPGFFKKMEGWRDGIVEMPPVGVVESGRGREQSIRLIEEEQEKLQIREPRRGCARLGCLRKQAFGLAPKACGLGLLGEVFGCQGMKDLSGSTEAEIGGAGELLQERYGVGMTAAAVGEQGPG